jgi:hypothetical protein
MTTKIVSLFFPKQKDAEGDFLHHLIFFLHFAVVQFKCRTSKHIFGGCLKFEIQMWFKI